MPDVVTGPEPARIEDGRGTTRALPDRYLTLRTLQSTAIPRSKESAEFSLATRAGYDATKSSTVSGCTPSYFIAAAASAP